jgi:hypothetical protein
MISRVIRILLLISRFLRLAGRKIRRFLRSAWKGLVRIPGLILHLFDVLLLLISPLALLMVIVALVMLVDTWGTHNRLRQALEEVPLTVQADVASCYPEDGYCFTTFVDQRGRERYGKLNWRYYSPEVRADLEALERGDQVLVRYPDDWGENEVILAGDYHDFQEYRGYFYDMGIVGLVSWFILIRHPEVLLFTLVDEIGAYFDTKWNRMVERI